MRTTIGTLIIALLAAAPVFAQTVRPSMRELVERSRAARARRGATEAAPNRVYTSEDVERYVPPLVSQFSEDDAQPSELAEGDAAAEIDLDDPEAAAEAARQEWLATIQALRAEIQELEDREVRQQLELTELRGVVTAPTGSQQERNAAMAAVVTGEAALEQIRADLVAVNEALRQLEVQGPPEP